MDKQIEPKVKPEEQKRHLIKAYLDDEEYEKFQLFAKACKCTNSNFVRQLLAGAHLVAFPPDEYMRLKNEFVKLGYDKKTDRKSWIEDIVVEEIKRLVHDDEAVAYIADCVMEIQGRENPILPCLREQLAEVEKGIGNLVNAIQMGICNDATKKRMDELEARKSELGIQIAKEELAKPIVTREQITCWTRTCHQMKSS